MREDRLVSLVYMVVSFGWLNQIDPFHPSRESRSASLLAGYGKTIGARQNFTDLYVWNNGGTPRRMLKKARLLTRPTLARQDVPSPKQGRRRVETGGVPSGAR